MKKILSLTLAVMLLVSMIPTAFAAETTDWESGTTITLNGSGTETYTVTVPATMSPGDTATVKAEGTWAADKFLRVTAHKTASLTCGAQSMDVGITFGLAYSSESIGFALLGSSTEEVTASYDLTVAEASRLFGTWTGTLTYEVDLVEKGDINRDGVIDAADITAMREMIGGTIEKDLTYADVNEDGDINNTDLTTMKRILGQNGIDVE